MPRARTTIRTASVVTATGLALSLTAALPAAADPLDPAEDIGAAATVSGYPVDEAALAAFHEQGISWGVCPEQEAVEAGLECAEFEVPLDYAAPDGYRVTIAVSRAAATTNGGQERLGVLMINPGGPGMPARHMPAALSDSATHDAYDLIGMDPRGTGASDPLDCGVGTPGIPPRATNAEITGHTRDVIQYARACDSAEGDRLPHMTSANTARDMDVLRAAMGEEQINYVGYSYGTYLGPVYGALFPERLNRSVLDSSVHPDLTWQELFLKQAPAYTANVERYTEWLAEHDDVYGFGTSHEEIIAVFDEASDRLREAPRDVPGLAGPADGTYFDILVGELAGYQGHWDQQSWLIHYLVNDEPLPDPEPGAEALGEADEADGSDGVFDMNTDLLSAVICETEWTDRISQYHAQAREYRDAHPYGNGAYWAVPQACTFTQNQPTEAPVELIRDGYPEPLVIAADHDPRTPYAGGPAMADRLDGSLLTVTDEGGHGFFLMPDPFTLERRYHCVNETVEAYLVDGEEPRDSECVGIPRSDSPAQALDDDAVTAILPDVVNPEEWLLPRALR